VSWRIQRDWVGKKYLGENMNIFVVDNDPVVAATMLCDKHVVKMIVETAQMLCTVGRSNGHQTKYRSTHARHPCTLWAGESKQNWDWLIKHGLSMCEEYTRRYGRRHKTHDVIESLSNLPIKLPNKGLTPFAQAMPDKYKSHDPIEAYRNYYKGEKSGFAQWKTSPPLWW